MALIPETTAAPRRATAPPGEVFKAQFADSRVTADHRIATVGRAAVAEVVRDDILVEPYDRPTISPLDKADAPVVDGWRVTALPRAPVPVARVPVTNILGVGTSVVNLSSAFAEIDRWIAEGERHYVCVTGVHGLMESRRDRGLRIIHNRAGLVLPDGMPVAWWLKLAGHSEADRVCGPEFMPYAIERSAGAGWRHFFYGATDATLSKIQAHIMRQWPDVHIAGAYSPPFRPLKPDEDQAVVDRINASGADVVWVGLSTPKQERWMAAQRPKLQAAALIGVGAAFDMLAGNVERAPMFLRRSGFEWVYRLAQEPRRLARRYLQNNPAFVLMAAAQISRLVAFPLQYDDDPAAG